MIVVIVAFILGGMGLFLGLMLLGVIVHIWPLLFVLGLWGVMHEWRKERERMAQEVRRRS